MQMHLREIRWFVSGNKIAELRLKPWFSDSNQAQGLFLSFSLFPFLYNFWKAVLHGANGKLLGSGEEVGVKGLCAWPLPAPPFPPREAMACLTAASESLACLLEPPAHVDFDGPEGAQRNDPALCCPIKNEQIKSLPPCQEVLITLTGGLNPQFTSCSPEKRASHTGDIGQMTWLKQPWVWSELRILFQGQAERVFWRFCLKHAVQLEDWGRELTFPRVTPIAFPSVVLTITSSHFNMTIWVCSTKWHCWDSF